MRVLLLGGSTEASVLANAIAADRRFKTVLSLAGRTATPRSHPIPMRSGGFGGADGLARYLRNEAIDALIDATHPFASRMSHNAIEAASASGIPLLAIERPAWEKQPGDIWIEAPDIDNAVQRLGDVWRTVFCAIGGLALHALQSAPQHTYIIRLIDAPPTPIMLPSFSIIQARGPFSTEADIALFQERKIEIVLAKNSGGVATISKIEAARALRLPVVMVKRPFIPPRIAVAIAAEALTWLERHYQNSMLRGV
jgi:precorrin-6A/cobalt-precorrin-6A reductase